ncbi:BTAD domain-containing putative transcriptional regulator [Gordonia sp. CPCC 205515]|uniref:BTAD domain-containing putative transcriptional regulator n=1 Tax=Gordonia sp. CPCC 205515 TaxID=3140791 RepID=UPI003AF36F6C
MSARIEATTPAVTVTMSGTVRVDVDGRAADVKSRRERAVLARLVAADGQVVSTDRLIDDLWNGEPPPKALGGLQVHISNLRRILEPQRAPRTPARIIVSEAPGYALRLPRAAVDLWRFADLVSRADGDPKVRHEHLDTALALWHGTPFGPYAADDWARPAVTHLDELHLVAVEQRAADALALGRPADAVSALTPVCDAHPMREESFRLTALAQYRLGRQADALETLRTLRHHLSEDLGVDPSPPIRELETAILQQDPALDRAPQPRVASIDEPAATPGHYPGEFAGRTVELERLTAHAESVRVTGLRVAWITAEAGGGKSTLAQAFVAQQGASGWAAAIGHCPEVDGAPTAWAWREIVGELGGDNELDDPFLIARQVAALGRSGPADTGTVIVLDDAHRADSATLQVLRQMVTWLADRPVFVLATYRPSEATNELMATGASLISVAVDVVALEGLSDDGIREVAAGAGLTPVDDETVALLRSRTDGNPLFVRELAKLVASRGTRDARTTVPSGVREVLLQRTQRLPADTVSVLRLLSVCGRSADVNTLIGLWPEPSGAEDTVLDAIDTAVVAGLLSTEGERVRFHHVLMRDAIYDDIPGLRRRRMHWRTGEYLRSLPASSPDELAVHAALGASAATADRALEIVEAAARRRSDGDLAADSAPLWQHAVDLHLLAGHDRPTADHAARAALVTALCELVTALAHRGESVWARQRREQALHLANALDDPQLVVAALTCWRTPWIWSTRTKGVLDEVMVTSLQSALSTASGAERARLLITAVMEYEGSDDQLAIDLAREAVDLTSTIDDLELRCGALNARIFTALGPDSRAEYPGLADDFLAAAEAAGSTEYTAAAHFYLFMVRMSQIDLPGAVGQMRQALQCATSGRVGELVVVFSAFAAVTEVLRGNLDAAEQRYQALSRSLIDAGIPAGEDFAMIGQLCIGWSRGSIGDVVDALEQAYDRSPQAVAWTYVLALIDAGRIDEARALAVTDLPVSRDYYWTSLQGFHARSLVRLGLVDQAAELYASLRDWSGTALGLDAGSVSFGPMDVVLAELADLLGDDAAAQRHRAIAAEVEERLERGLEQIGRV